MENHSLSDKEYKRYSRHLLLPEIGEEGQQKLKAAKVLVVGAGGLGAPVLQYFAAAGVGRIGIADFDTVDETNLQRQVLFSEQDIGRSKVDAAIEKLTAMNSMVQYVPHPKGVTKGNALELLNEYDLVIDGSDNFATRYLVNDACVILGKPLVYGSIYRFTGQVSVFNVQHEGKRTGNYRDVFPEQPEENSIPDCSEAGVLGVLPGIIGCIQANEAIKLITETGELLVNRLLTFDALSMKFQEFRYTASEANQTIKELSEYNVACVSTEVKEVDVNQLREWIDSGQVAVIDVREKEEFAAFNIGGIHIPLADLLHRQVEVPQNQKVVFVCQSGKRSAAAIQELSSNNRSEGYYNLSGGLNAWKEKLASIEA